MINPTHKQLFKTAINNLNKKLNPNIMSIVHKTVPNRPIKQPPNMPQYNIEQIIPLSLLNDFDTESKSAPPSFTYYCLDPNGQIIQDTSNYTYDQIIYKHFENKTIDNIIINIKLNQI